MKLFRWENNDITVSEEALGIKAFRKIWNRDRSQNKNRAKQDLSFLYFFCDPRSDYSFLINLEDRMDRIKLDLGFEDSWKPDSIIEEAIETYNYLTNTTTSRLLGAAREAAESIIQYLKKDNLLDETDSKGKPINSIQAVTATIAKIPEVMVQIQKAEQLMNKELTEESRMRGKGEKKIFEDGFA